MSFLTEVEFFKVRGVFLLPIRGLSPQNWPHRFFSNSNPMSFRSVVTIPLDQIFDIQPLFSVSCPQSEVSFSSTHSFFSYNPLGRLRSNANPVLSGSVGRIPSPHFPMDAVFLILSVVPKVRKSFFEPPHPYCMSSPFFWLPLSFMPVCV